MPTCLENLVQEIAPGLDEKAQAALNETDPVNALAFLQRLSGRGDQVRNPSAFIATAVKTAATRGPSPGAAELECALQRLRQDGTLDDNAVEVLHKGSTQEACAALAALLGQDASTVRNASAYITRNMMNAKKQGPMGAPQQMGKMGGGKGAMMGMGGGMLALQAPAAAGKGGQGAAQALAAKWRGALDHKALASLTAVGPNTALEILQEMDSRGGAVRNPSAYVQRACENRKVTGDVDPVPDGLSGAAGMGALMAQHQGALDADAHDALSKVSEEQGAQILANLESRSATVRNPS
eukprot:CAMPEP_0168397434 /NCGR_PEP_ID=MMETSP0228-20121227/21062_1 /TAXON_ID=133427 /ORGANISM="Protoceratium reticulatum, Strain CCCM 535 (=CCMP 1889)" /LENGTH=295 /DNA_ID=CAMNT_0008410907 /DNA_START=130 /DNA_END=1013 /DNA_ORIENTATION=+